MAGVRFADFNFANPLRIRFRPAMTRQAVFFAARSDTFITSTVATIKVNVHSPSNLV